MTENTDLDPSADEMSESLIAEIKGIAEREMYRERVGHTLQATAVANEAWMVLVRQRNLDPKDRSHYLAAAATTIRRYLVNYARKRAAKKRGGDYFQVSLQVVGEDAAKVGEKESVDLSALDTAMEKLAKLNKRASRVVELRFFAGLTMKEVAKELGIAERTAYEEWSFAKAWLLNQLRKADE